MEIDNFFEKREDIFRVTISFSKYYAIILIHCLLYVDTKKRISQKEGFAVKRIQKIVSGILVFCLVLPMLSMQVLAVEETVADAEVIIDAAYAISEDAEKTVIASDEPERKVASDFTYSYDEKRHKLTISGNGDMPSWEAYEDAPWYSLDYALVEIGEGLTSIGSYAFAYDYAGLGEFTIPYFIIPESVTQVGSNAFFGNAAKLRFRGDAPEFHAAAFEKAVQISVFYPENNETWTTDIQQNYGADMADWNCAYTSGTYACGAKWSYDDSTGVMTLSGEEMPELFPILPDWNVFFSGTISSVQIEDGVPEIVESAFKDCYDLSTISIPDSVTVIGPDAFRKCYSLEELELPDSITEIAIAFYRCDNLTKIKFTGNAPVFDEHAFVNHTLTAYYPAGNTTWTEEVMQDYGGDITWVPYGEEHVHEYDATHKCECGAIGGTCGENLIWEFNLENGNLIISGSGAMETYAFDMPPWDLLKDHIISINIADGVTSISTGAFEKCTELTEVTMANSVTDFGSAIFNECTKLTKVTLSNSVKLIPSAMFRECKALESILLPNGITAIDNSAFDGCVALQEIIFPASVQELFPYAFYQCSNLKKVTFEGNAPVIWEGDPYQYGSFAECELTAYYPINNPTWTEEVMQDYGGDITWKPYCPDGHTYDNDQDTTCNDCGFVRELEDAEIVTVPMYRLYNPYTLEHLLTADAAERDLLVGAGWSLDGVAWESPDEGDRVYRLYNPYDDWHTYSMDQAEIDMLVPLGWKIDGAVCHSATKAEGKPVYRLFNPYEQKNYHLLTASEEERENLMELGWTLDGVAWYCLTD